jgi:predicted DNA-binding ribbon-helix-helix protein
VAADEEREIGVGLKLKRPYRDALQLIARDRKLSMANYTRKIIEEHIRSVFPNVEKR